MSKIFVIAGTKQEADYWIINDLGKKYPTNTSMSMSDYVYVDSVTRIKGYSNPHGVFVGNWLGRPDILEIVEGLMIASTHVNPALGKIYSDLKPKVKPTPKIKVVGKNAWINENILIQDAADLLAKSIDEQVLKDMGI
jgi:hypothetical protein